MAISASLFQVLEDDSTVVDCRVDLYVPPANGMATFTVGLLVPRSGLPSPYTWDDLATACTSLLDTAGLSVVATPPA